MAGTVISRQRFAAKPLFIGPSSVYHPDKECRLADSPTVRTSLSTSADSDHFVAGSYASSTYLVDSNLYRSCERHFSFSDIGEERLQVREAIARADERVRAALKWSLSAPYDYAAAFERLTSEALSKEFGCDIHVIKPYLGQSAENTLICSESDGFRTFDDLPEPDQVFYCSNLFELGVSSLYIRSIDEIVAQMSLLSAVRRYGSLLQRQRLLNTAFRLLLRRLADFRCLKELFLVQADWFYFHGDHPPHELTQANSACFEFLGCVPNAVPS